jgi:hypothetical protein
MHAKRRLAAPADAADPTTFVPAREGFCGEMVDR